jgi:oligopeptide transport system permease protein
MSDTAKIPRPTIPADDLKVAAMLEAFVDGTGDSYDWDDFISIPQKDPLLEQVRDRCAGLSWEYQSPTPNRYCSEAGMQVFLEIARQLRSGQMREEFRPSALPASPHLTPNQRAWLRLRRNKPAVVSAAFLLLMLALALLVPLLSPHAADHGSGAQFAVPGTTHWFGTDVHGRDVFTRVFAGARISLLVGAVGTAVSLVIGVCWGLVAGYVGGRLDGLMMRFVDVLYSLPSIIFVIVLITTLETLFKRLLAQIAPDLSGSARLLFLFVGLGAVSWLTMARIVRGQVLSLRHRPFVLASQALGAGHARILFRHILPNVTGIVIVYLTLTVPAIVLYESFLSYLGLGIQPPQASLGTLIAEGAAQINPIRVYWWLVVCPGAVLALTLLALNFLGDGLRDALDPRAD